MNPVMFYIRRILGQTRFHANFKLTRRKKHPDFDPNKPAGHGKGKQRPPPFSRI